MFPMLQRKWRRLYLCWRKRSKVNEEKVSIGKTKGAGGGASTKAIVALVLGIVGLVFCPPTAIVAWILGKQELNAIARGESSAQGRGVALAGFILGIIGTVLVVSFIMICALVILGTVAAGIFGEGFGQLPGKVQEFAREGSRFIFTVI